jgi:hypothetical protein
LHCAKAFFSSKLWNPNSRQDRGEMPTVGNMTLDQFAASNETPTGKEVVEADEFVDNRHKTGLYRRKPS